MHSSTTALESAPASGWALLFVCWLVASVSTLGALFLSEVMEIAPCVLCWYQRIAMFPLVLKQIRRDMDAPAIAGIIEQDIQDAKTMNVTKTPEFFVNGRPLPSFGYEQLKSLVDDALAAAYR